MDWALAIERNRQPLLRIVAALFAMIGLGEAVRSRACRGRVYRAVLIVLRPAEAAVRRLIVVAARGMVVTPKTPRPAPAGRIISSRKGQGRVSFQLFDPRRVLAGNHGRYDAVATGNPRIHVIDVVFDPRIPLFRPARAVARMNPKIRRTDHTVNAGPLCRRLAAIRSALEDLPRQAQRYARWRATASRDPPPEAPTHPCAPARRRACASGRPARWTRSWPNATGSPATQRPPTRHDGNR